MTNAEYELRQYVADSIWKCRKYSKKKNYQGFLSEMCRIHGILTCLMYTDSSVGQRLEKIWAKAYKRISM